jgi:hypothetical protein
MIVCIKNGLFPHHHLKPTVMKFNPSISSFIFLSILVFGFTACTKDNQILPGGDAEFTTSDRSTAPDVVYYALADGAQLDKYSAAAPDEILNSAAISGLQPGEKILGIDFRPATGQLFGVGSTSRIYVIDPETGAATMVGATPFTPALEGGVTSFDFNPTVDRIRLVTGTGQNLRLNPNTGTVAVVDGTINGQDGAQIAGVAYTNNFAGATTTTLYGIDIVSEKLFAITPPNNGTLVEVGPLMTQNHLGEGGFDISGDVALCLFKVNQKATLFTVDLATGRAEMVYKYKMGQTYTGLAIPIQ